MKRALIAAVFSLLLGTTARGQTVRPESIPQRFTTSETPELIALTNLGANPGIGAASFTIDQPNGQPSLRLGGLGLRGGLDVGPRDQIYRLYVGGAVGRLTLTDAFTGALDSGESVRLETKKQLTTGGLLVGVDYSPAKVVHIRPELGVGLSRLTSDTSFPDGGDPSMFIGVRDARLLRWDVWATTIAPAIDLLVDVPFDHHRFEAELTWAHGFHRSFSESAKELHFSGYTNTLYGRTQFTSPTPVSIYEIPIDWDVQFQVTHFLTGETDPLGFSTVMVASAGLDLRLERKLWIFPLRSAGPKVGFIFGPNIHGFSLGLSVRG
ncbi:MAG: hypothetical protein ACJ790_22445 [Myxococcaceae bacterium]